MSMNTPTQLVPPAEVSRYKRAYEESQADRDALDASQLVSITRDIPTIVKTIRGAVVAILPFKAQAANVPGFDASLFDKLEPYALALGHAHTEVLAASAPLEPIDEMVEELIAIREALLSDLQPLAFAGLVDGTRLDLVKRANGSNNVANEVMLLANLARRVLPAVTGKSMLTAERVARAEQLADHVVKAVGMKELLAQNSSPQQEQRRRAFNLLVMAYEEVRHVLSFLRRREKDVDEIAPSIYAMGRPRHYNKAGDSDDTQQNTQPVVSPTPTAPVVPPGFPRTTGLPDESPTE